MQSSTSMERSLLFSLFLLFSVSIVAQSTVPSNSTFKKVNTGEWAEAISEYRSDFRALDISTSVFQVCFYNTTPNAFTLAIRMGTRRSPAVRRFVWEANRGNPVGEDATLTFGEDGNLILADADGRVAWQTNTADKGVVGLQMLPNGNMVLHDSKGNFIWQSFDYPTDTLLVGQSLRVGAVTRLVSRASDKMNTNGAYSLVLEPKRIAMYYKSPNSPKPYVYYTSDLFSIQKGRLQYVRLINSANDLSLQFSTGGGPLLSKPDFNSTLSFLRLGVDGNLRVYSFNNQETSASWDVTFTLFSKDVGVWESECQLPEKCGKFGLCEDSQCVGCPLPNGLGNWTESCEPVKVTVCNKNFHYYKLEGVDHSMSKYGKGNGPLKENDCEKECSSDCKCSGYFYNTKTSMCWIAYDLQTLTRVANSTHVGYIKVPNHQ
ncbi:epidermis-specific secreted glycoprotein EP1 [Populus alba]|nr:epidermis-specific secreted glycoprotein EP1-like [Populus alba]